MFNIDLAADFRYNANVFPSGTSYSMFDDGHSEHAAVQQANTLQNTNALSLEINWDPVTHKWDIFDAASGDNDRDLVVVDAVETVDLGFVFICAPVDDVTNLSARTLWNIGGMEMRNNLTPTDAYIARNHALTGTFTATRATWWQESMAQPPQYRWRNRTLTQIAAPGEYTELYLLNEDTEYNHIFFTPCNRLLEGSGVAVKMNDGSWQIHGAFDADGTARTATSTAMRTYPSRVTNRDHFWRNDVRRTLYTGTHSFWARTTPGNAGQTNLYSATALGPVQIGRHIEAWKSDTNVVTIRHGRTLASDAGFPEATLTIPADEEIKQIQCFAYWNQRATGNLRRDTTTQVNNPLNAHPADTDRTSNLTVFVVTESNNLYIAGANNDYVPLTADDGTTASLTIPDLPGSGSTVAMVQLSGDWDGNVDRIEAFNQLDTIRCSGTRGRSNAGVGMAPNTNHNFENNIVILTNTSDFYIHRSVNNGSTICRLNSNFQNGPLAYVCCYMSGGGTVPNNSAPCPILFTNVTANLLNSLNRTYTETYTLRTRARWVKGTLPSGVPQRVAGSSQGNFYVINNFGVFYDCVTQDDTNDISAIPFSGRVSVRMASFQGGRGYETVSSNDYYPGGI